MRSRGPLGGVLLCGLAGLALGCASTASSPEGAAAWRARRSALLVTLLETRHLATLPEVSESETDKYLAAHPEELGTEERLRLRHVFLRLPRLASPGYRAWVHGEMAELRARLEAGDDFARLARECSDSQTAGFGGLLPPVRRGELPPGVEAVVSQLAIGELSPVVDTPEGLHVFRLEELLPAAPIAPEAARRQVRDRLGKEARVAARTRYWSELEERAGASSSPGLLERPWSDREAVVLSLGRERLTLGELLDRWSRLPFAQQRLTSLAALLEEATRGRLAERESERLRLESDPQIAADLERAKHGLALELALDRRLDAVRRGFEEGELRAFLEANRRSFVRPASRRLRMILRRFGEGETPPAVLERMERAAEEIRVGRLDFGAAVRSHSTDASAGADGDLGWVEAQTLGAWGGKRLVEAVFRLPVGATSSPLLVEVYEPDHLRYRADGYALFRVEEERPERSPGLEEIRAEVVERLLRTRREAVRRQLGSMPPRAGGL